MISSDMLFPTKHKAPLHHRLLHLLLAHPLLLLCSQLAPDQSLIQNFARIHNMISDTNPRNFFTTKTSKHGFLRFVVDLRRATLKLHLFPCQLSFRLRAASRPPALISENLKQFIPCLTLSGVAVAVSQRPCHPRF